MKLKLLLISFLTIGICSFSYAQSNKRNNSQNTSKNNQTTVTKPGNTNTTATNIPGASNPRRPATANPQGLTSTDLMEPEKNGGRPFYDVYSNIRPEMTMAFSPEDLSQEKMSTLLYIACGVTDKENRCYTAFTTNQDATIDIYVITREQIMKYDRLEHKLLVIRKVHFLEKVTMQREMPIDAPIAIVYVCNPNSFKPEENDDNDIFITKGGNCGAIMQNVFLYCANEDLSCKAISIPNNVKAEFLKHINSRDAEVLYGQIIGRR